MKIIGASIDTGPFVFKDVRIDAEVFLFRKGTNLWKIVFKNSVWTALSNAILTLRHDDSLREKIAEERYRTFREKASPRILGQHLTGILKEFMRESQRQRSARV